MSIRLCQLYRLKSDKCAASQENENFSELQLTFSDNVENIILKFCENLEFYRAFLI